MLMMMEWDVLVVKIVVSVIQVVFDCELEYVVFLGIYD